MTNDSGTQTQSREERRDSFVTYLEELRERDDRGQLAAMRRWLARSAGSQVEATRVVQPQLTMSSYDMRKDIREEATYLIGALFALHHREISHTPENMGDHFRAMFQEGEPPPPNVERRFMSLLACDADDFDVALRQAVMLLKSKEVPINWHQLIWDTMTWKGKDEAKRDEVRMRWARRFWRRPATNAPSAAPEGE
jgi:CRISPR system Cascade subunit CasB